MADKEIATAYVSVVPSAKGFGRSLLADVGGEQIGVQIGGQVSRGVLSQVGGMATQIKSLLGGALAAGVLAVGGTVLGKGISRLLDIEDADAKLRGLGNSAKTVSQIMADALAAVKGTAFGLGDAATVAASAVAAGVAPGKALENYLRLTADAATIAGTSLSDMGSIINKVKTSGKAYTDDLNQLADRGIPIFQWLAKEYGVTQQALSKMVQNGQVDSETFNKVITENIGGAALSSGDTTRGAFSNMLASLGRIGAGLIKGVFPDFKAFFQGVTTSLAPIEAISATVGKAVGGTATFFGGLPAPVLASVAALTALALLRNPLVSGIGAVSTTVASSARNFGILRQEAMLAGASMPGLRVGVAGVGSALKSAGGALLAFSGGWAGLAIAAGVVAATAAITAWTGATEAHKEAVDALTASLDQNTGAVTVVTAQTIFKGLDDAGAIAQLESLKINTKDAIAAITAGGPALDSLRAKLKSISDASVNNNPLVGGITDPSKLAAAQAALRAIDTQTSSLSASQDDFSKKLRAGVTATDANTGATDANTAAKTAAEAAAAALATKTKAQTEALKNATDAAFSQSRANLTASDSVANLAASFVKNGKSMSSNSTKGIANSQALMDSISALATAAGSDTNRFIGNVAGLLNAVRSQGVNTSSAVQAVLNTLDAASRSKFKVALDGSQALAEARAIIRANIAVAKSYMVLAATQNTGDHADNAQANTSRSISIMQGQLAELNSIAGAASSIGSTYSGAYSGAIADTAKKAGSAATSTKTSAAAAQAAARAAAAAARSFSLTKIANASAPDTQLYSSYQTGRGLIADAYKANGISKAAYTKMNADLTKQYVKIRDASTAIAKYAAGFGSSQLINGIYKSGADISSAASKAAAEVDRQFKKGLISKEARDAAVQSIKDTKTELLAAAAEAQAAIQNVGKSLTDWLSPSTVSSGAQSTMDAILDAFNSKGITGATRDRLIAAVRSSDSQMQAIATQREALATKITDANSALSNAISTRDSFRDAVKAAVVGFGDVAKLYAAAGDGLTTVISTTLNGITTSITSTGKNGTANDITVGLQKQLDSVKSFRATLAGLKSIGLDDTTYKQLEDGFLSSGDGSAAAAILAGGSAAVATISGLQQQLADAGAGLGDDSSNVLYQAGVNAAQGLLDGLNSQDAALVAAAKRIADTLTSTVKTQLGIHSPSRVMRALAVFTGRGFVDGLDSMQSAVASSAADLVALPTPNGLNASLQSISTDDSTSSTDAVGSERPIYMDSGELFGVMRTIANGEARIVLAADLHELAVSL